MVTRQFADKPTRGHSSHGLVNSSDISVSKINSVSITVLCVIVSFKFLLYFYFGNNIRFSIQFSDHFILVSVFISVSGFSMLDTES